MTAMRYYSNNRDQYKTLGDYYPELTRCLEKNLKGEKK